MPSDPPRIAREKQTIRAMVAIYCRAHHGTAGEVCDDCRQLLDYAFGRLDRCFFGAEKPACANCPVHCYKPSMREKAKAVMRYAGGRMIYKHPVMAARHWLDGLRRRDRPDG
jgi:hypothetical protein